MSTTDALAARLTDDLNNCRHFGLLAHERVRRDPILAWLRSQRTDQDVTSGYALMMYWNSPDAHRQQRVIALIAAREQQLRRFPNAFWYWMAKARNLRQSELRLRSMEVAA
jgi:hypothetical protein